MKTKITWVGKIVGVFILLAFFLTPFKSYSQEIIYTEEKDTLITLTPKQVPTINLVFSDLKWQKEKNKIQEERIELMSERIKTTDTELQSYSLLTKELENEILQRELIHKNILKKEKTKWILVGGGTGIVLGVLITLICVAH